jgi:hypothetical protein
VVESPVDDLKYRNSGGADLPPGQDSTRKNQGRAYKFGTTGRQFLRSASRHLGDKRRRFRITRSSGVTRSKLRSPSRSGMSRLSWIDLHGEGIARQLFQCLTTLAHSICSDDLALYLKLK